MPPQKGNIKLRNRKTSGRLSSMLKKKIVTRSESNGEKSAAHLYEAGDFRKPVSVQFYTQGCMCPLVFLLSGEGRARGSGWGEGKQAELGPPLAL